MKQSIDSIRGFLVHIKVAVVKKVKTMFCPTLEGFGSQRKWSSPTNIYLPTH